MSEQEQDDSDAEFVEIDPTGRYGRVSSFTVSFLFFFFFFFFFFFNFGFVEFDLNKAALFRIKFFYLIFDIDWHLGYS